MKPLWKVLSVTVIAASLITAYALRAEKNSANNVVLDSFDQTTNTNAQQLVADGRQIFRFDTFGDEDYWGGTLQLHKAIEGAKFGEISLLTVTPKWLERMKSLPNLERLKLQGCNRIDDDSVQTLVQMRALKQLDLQGTGVTEKGAAILRDSKPGVIVFFGPWDGKSANYRNN